MTTTPAASISPASDLTFETTSREVVITGRRVHYHEAGNGPVLVALHGSGPGVSGWANFGGNIGPLAERFRVIVLDLPGFGRTEGPDRYECPYVAEAAATVLSLLDELRISSAHLLGNSLGGGIAASLAMEHPDRVERLVMMAPGLIGQELFAPMPSEGLRRIIDFVKDPSRDALVAWLQTMVFDQATLTEEMIEQRVRAALEPSTLASTRRVFASLVDPQLRLDVPMWARAPALPQPTLIAWGRDDRVVPLDSAFLPLRLLPDVELHVFARCGHWAQIERQADFEQLVVGFLTR